MHGRRGQDVHAGRAGIVALLGSALVAACRAGGGPVPVQPSADCIVSGEEAPPEISVGLTHSPDPERAPVPRNTSERLVFRQLYDTLVRVDCTGRVLPGLAESWSMEDGGRVWTFRIRADAAFWDGRSVSARDVANGWAANAEGSPRAAETFARIGVQGARTLHVELHRPARYAHLFAHPDFAVARRDAGATWPIGSGPFRIDTHADGARREKLSLEATGDASATPRSIELEIVTGPDPRRALDAGADVLVSSDAAVLRYARALPEYTAEPLTWSRTYVLATRARTASAERLTMPPREAQLALARDAVRADVRPAQPSPWAERADCPLDPAAQAGPPAAARRRDAIAYPRDDAIARGIAERLVALAWPSARAPTWLRALRPDTADDAPTALALDDAALLEALREDVAAAFVLPISRAVADACGELTPADPALARDPLSAGEWRLVPLLDGRDHIIHRRGIGTLTLDADGAVRFARARP